MHRVFTAAMALQWAIDERWLRTILAIANREGAGPEAVAKELGEPLENTHTVEMRDGVAIIPVCGPIFRRANLFSQVSGATSIQVLAQDLNRALEDDTVDAVLFEFDSPGGEVSGTSELAAMIYDARKVKPVYAYVGGTGASAAYWLASACSRIIVADTASVGSIGVVQAVPDPRGPNANGTAKDIEIVSSQSPSKRANPTTKEGRAVYQAEVDALCDVFVAAVAKHRGVTPKAVISKFGEGACLVGAAAVAAGMADRVGSLESAIEELQKKTGSSGSSRAMATRQTQRNSGGSMAAKTNSNVVSVFNPQKSTATAGSNSGATATLTFKGKPWSQLSFTEKEAFLRAEPARARRVQAAYQGLRLSGIPTKPYEQLTAAEKQAFATDHPEAFAKAHAAHQRGNNGGGPAAA